VPTAPTHSARLPASGVAIHAQNRSQSRSNSAGGIHAQNRSQSHSTLVNGRRLPTFIAFNAGLGVSAGPEDAYSKNGRFFRASLRLAAGVVAASPDVPAFVSCVCCCSAFDDDGAVSAEACCFASFAGVVG
jgi:hypothetical protein